jgi:hypothetical protein
VARYSRSNPSGIRLEKKGGRLVCVVFMFVTRFPSTSLKDRVKVGLEGFRM